MLRGMGATGASQSRIMRASLAFLLLWLPACVIAAFTAFIACLTLDSAPLFSAISFLLAIPAVLVGVKSLRWSAIAMAVLLVWQVISTAWPHFQLNGFFNSIVDVLLLIATALTVVVWLASPFPSLEDFILQLRRPLRREDS
ncbi:MAG TPA: hypothetical protein VHX60_07680 [Acidobacteriaceae bacterium]|nr:hypothetical protein [Acidobacteriaceae bacterium]